MECLLVGVLAEVTGRAMCGGLQAFKYLKQGCIFTNISVLWEWAVQRSLFCGNFFVYIECYVVISLI